MKNKSVDIIEVTGYKMAILISNQKTIYFFYFSLYQHVTRLSKNLTGHY